MDVITRRGFLVGSALFVGGAIACSRAKVTEPTRTGTKVVYRLDPNWGPAEGCSGPCAACKQCQAHAANKLWRSKDTLQRAHPHCKCVIRGDAIEAQRYSALFDAPQNPEGLGVDRRWTWVKEALGRSSIPSG